MNPEEDKGKSIANPAAFSRIQRVSLGPDLFLGHEKVFGDKVKLVWRCFGQDKEKSISLSTTYLCCDQLWGPTHGRNDSVNLRSALSPSLKSDIGQCHFLTLNDESGVDEPPADRHLKGSVRWEIESWEHSKPELTRDINLFFAVYSSTVDFLVYEYMKHGRWFTPHSFVKLLILISKENPVEDLLVKANAMPDATVLDVTQSELQHRLYEANGAKVFLKLKKEGNYLYFSSVRRWYCFGVGLSTFLPVPSTRYHLRTLEKYK